MGDRPSLLTDVTEGARLGGPRTLVLEPLRSPRDGLNNLLSLKSDAFIRRGFGVLKMDRVSRNRALLAKTSLGESKKSSENIETRDNPISLHKIELLHVGPAVRIIS